MFNYNYFLGTNKESNLTLQNRAKKYDTFNKNLKHNLYTKPQNLYRKSKLLVLPETIFGFGTLATY